MSEQTAHQALEKALVDLLEEGAAGDKSASVAPTSHEIDTLRLFELAEQLRTAFSAPVEIISDDGKLAFKLLRSP